MVIKQELYRNKQWEVLKMVRTSRDPFYSMSSGIKSEEALDQLSI